MDEQELVKILVEQGSKVGSELINKSFGALSWIFDPHGIKAAERDGYLRLEQEIMGSSKISSKDKILFMNEFRNIRKRNGNVLKAIGDSISFLDDSAKPENMDDDWLVDFFDKVGKISDVDVRIIWSKLLAEEANSPRRFSKKLLHNLFLMSPQERDAFSNLSAYCFLDRCGAETNAHPIIFIRDHPRFYADNMITPEILSSLQYLGLVECNYLEPFIFANKKLLLYGSHHVDLYGETINAGNIRLTLDGQALFTIIEKSNSTTKLDFTIGVWKELGIHVQTSGISQHYETVLTDEAYMLNSRHRYKR